jgi:hypothetical protein
MRSTPDFHQRIDDDAIEALISGEAVDSPLALLDAFVRAVRGLGAEPSPSPSAELAGLMSARARPAAGLARRVAAGAALTAAGIAAAGAAGVLPAAATGAVRDAIAVVTPLGSGDPAGDAPSHGDRVSDDATGQSDGEPGVVGSDVADQAPGAAHRADPATGDVPGQTDVTGVDRAAETPAAPHLPSSSGPPQSSGPDDDDPARVDPPDPQGGAPTPVPSTVPEQGGQPEDEPEG